jgi:hypothetical protein
VVRYGRPPRAHTGDHRLGVGPAGYDRSCTGPMTIAMAIMSLGRVFPRVDVLDLVLGRQTHGVDLVM